MLQWEYFVIFLLDSAGADGMKWTSSEGDNILGPSRWGRGPRKMGEMLTVTTMHTVSEACRRRGRVWAAGSGGRG